MERQKAGQRDWGWGGRTRCRLRHRDGEGKKKTMMGCWTEMEQEKVGPEQGREKGKKGQLAGQGGITRNNETGSGTER